MRTRVLGMLTVALLAAAGLALAQPAQAADDEFAAGGVVYRINTDGAGVSAVGLADDFTGTELAIPDTVTYTDGTGSASYPVTAIPDSPPDNGGWNGSFASTDLTRVTLGDNITSIGRAAFAQNHSLTSVALGSAVRSIGIAAFMKSALTAIDLPDTLQSIGINAFTYTHLTQITLPGNLTTLGAWAFNHDHGLAVTFAGAAPATIGTGTEAPFLGDAAIHFNCRYADPAAATNPGQTVFALDPEGKWRGYDGTAPTSPIITYRANGVAGVAGTSHPIGCGMTAADDAQAPQLPTGAHWYTDAEATHKASAAVYTDTTLYAGAPDPVEATADGIFYRYDLKNVDAGATAVGPDPSFTGTALDIPDTVTFDGITYKVTAIGNAAFNEEQLTAVTIGGNVTRIGTYAFNRNDIDRISIPDSVTTIGQVAFGSNHLQQLTLGDSIAVINDRAFADNRLTSVTFPGSVTALGDEVFLGNPDLSSVVFEGAPPTTITSRIDNHRSLPATATVHFSCAYADPSLTDPFTLGTWKGYASVGSDVVVTYDPNGIPTVTGVTDTIRCGTTAADDPKAPYLPTGAGWYTDANATHKAGALYSDATLYAGAPDPVEASADGILYRYDLTKVDAGATAIGLGSGFIGTALDIPDTVTFDGITYKVTAIGDRAFQDKSLTAVAIGDNVAIIGTRAFTENFALTAVTLGSSVAAIGEHAFSYDYIGSIAFPDSVITIGSSAFLNNALESVSVPDSVTKIGVLAFGNNRLTHLTIGDGVAVIEVGAFVYNKLTNVTIPGSVTTLGDQVFFGNLDLSTVSFQGAAPATIKAGTSEKSSLPADATVHFTCSYADPVTHENPFTVGTWEGYTSLGSTISYTFDMNGVPGTGLTTTNIPCGDSTPVAYSPAAPDGVHWYSDATATTRAEKTGAHYTDTTFYAGMAPQISYPTAEGVAGDALSVTPTITAVPSATFALADGSTLPKGLSLDHVTGTVSGTPHAAVTDAVTIIASNPVGQTAASLSLAIAPAPGILFHLTAAGAPFQPGSPVTVTGAGVPAGTAVQIEVRSDPITLGTVTADASGAFALTATLPTGLEAGAHTISASITVNGTTSTQSVPITVTAAAPTAGDTNPAVTNPADTNSAGTSADATTTGAGGATDLAATGGDASQTALWAWLGLAALAAGLGLVAVRRRLAR